MRISKAITVLLAGGLVSAGLSVGLTPVASAQYRTLNPEVGKANLAESNEEFRPAPNVVEGTPASFETAKIEPSGTGPQPFAGKTDSKSQADAKSNDEAQRGKPVAANFVEGSAEVPKEAGGKQPKVQGKKSRFDERESQTSVDDPEPLDPPKKSSGRGKSKLKVPANQKKDKSSKTVEVSSGPSPTVFAENGNFRAKIGTNEIVLSDLDDPNGTIRLAGTGFSIGLRPLSGRKDRPVASKRRVASNAGKKVRWNGVFDGGEVIEEEIVSAGAKGAIVLPSLSKRSSWQFELALSDGLTPVLGDGRALTVRDDAAGLPINIFGENGIVASLPAGDAEDANGDTTRTELSLSRAKDSRWIVTVSVDAQWLRGASYPVRVDPTIVGLAYSGAGIKYPGQAAFPASGGGAVGYGARLYSNQSILLQYDLSALGTAPNVLAAHLVVSADTCAVGDAYDIYRLKSSPWGIAGEPDYDNSTFVGAQQLPTIPAGNGSQGYAFWSFTDLVKGWANGTIPNHGVVVRVYAPWGCNVNVGALTVDYNALPTVTAQSPADNATGLPYRPTFSATATDVENDSISYKFEVCWPSFAAAVNCLSQSAFSASSTYTPASDIPPNTTGQWRVKVTDQVGVREGTSPARTFTTQPAPNGAPIIDTMNSPASYATNVPLRPTFSATAHDPDGNPIEYSFRVCTAGCPTDGVWGSPWQTSNTWTPTFDLPYGTDLYWIVSVRDTPTPGSGASSTVWAGAYVPFRTILRPNSAPPTPTLGGTSSPPNGAVNTIASPILQALSSDPDGDAVQYQYTVCVQNGTCIAPSPWVSGAWQVSAGSLAYNTVFTWSAQARDTPPASANASLTSPQSGTFTFRTQANPTNAVTAPVAVAPLAGTGVTSKPILQVAATDADGDQIEYQFQICAPDFGSSAQCFTSAWRALPHWQVSGLLDWGTNYTWRAWARNVADPNGTGTIMATPQTVTVNVATTDDPIGGVSGFNPYVELEGLSQEEGGVNEAVGQLTYSHTDIELPSVTGQLKVTRTYNGRLRNKGFFGRGWTSNLDARVVYKVSNSSQAPTLYSPVEVVLPDGRRQGFARVQSGAYYPTSPGFYNDFFRDANNNFVYKLRNRTTYIFDSNGLLLRFEDINGNQLNYTYSGTAPNQVLTQITDSKSGRSLNFTFAGGFLTRVQTPTVAAHASALAVDFVYTGNQLTQACPPRTATITTCWAYGWSGERLTKVTKPKGNVELEVGYDPVGFLIDPTVNLAPNPSFETANAGWSAATGSQAPTFAATGGLFGSGLVNSAGATTPFEIVSTPVPVEGAKFYNLSAFVRGTAASSGDVQLYWEGLDVNQNPITDPVAGYSASGPALRNGDQTPYSTTTVWTPISGSFRTPENVKFVKLKIKWAAPTATVSIDGVMLTKGDGLTNRVSWRKNGRGFQTNYGYNFVGATLEVTTDDARPFPPTKTVYNTDTYKIIKDIDAANRQTSYGYDANGFISSMTDPAGRVTNMVNNARGNVVTRTKTWFTPPASEYYEYVGGTDLVLSYRDPRSSGPADNTYRWQYTYDTAGNKTSEIDPFSNKTKWEYSLGTETAFGSVGVMPKGFLLKWSDRSGTPTAAGASSTYTYDSRGDLRQVDDSRSGVVRYTTDEIGRVTKDEQLLAGAVLATTDRVYDVRSRVTQLTGPAVANLVTAQSRQSRVDSVFDGNSNPTKVTISDVGGKDTARVTDYTYNDDDLIASKTEPLTKVTSYGYDEVGNVVLETDPRSLRTRTEYDDRSLAIKKTTENYFDTVGGTTRPIQLAQWTRDLLGRVTVETTPSGTTAFDYANTDQIKTITRKSYVDLAGTTRDVVVQQMEYDNVGNMTMSRSGGTEETRRNFDARNFMTDETVGYGQLNRSTNYTYDPEGRILTQGSGRLVIRTSYHNASKKLATRETLGVGPAGGAPATESYAYDTRGRLVSYTTKRNNVTTYTYDALDRTVKVESPSTTVWNAAGTASSTARPTKLYGFNTFGEQTDFQDERGLKTVTLIDTLGRVSQITYPANGTVPTEKFTYDTAGNKLTYIDRRNQTTNFAYDAFNRTRTITEPAPVAGGARPATTMTYNDASQLTQQVDPNGVTTKATWDVLGRQRTAGVVMRQKANAEWTTTFDYSDAGRRTAVIDPRGKAERTDFNAVGQPTKVTDRRGDITEFTYEEPMGWLQNTTIGGLRRSKKSYDDAGRLIKVEALAANGTVMSTDQWEYDYDSNQIAHTRPNGARDITNYDELGRVSGSGRKVLAPNIQSVTSGGYDAAGNLVRVVDPRNNVITMTYNNLGLLASTVEPETVAGQAIADRTWAVTYNAAGDPTSETRPGQAITRTFDLLGRMTGESGSGSGLTAASKSFTYDAGGRMTATGAETFAYLDNGQLNRPGFCITS